MKTIFPKIHSAWRRQCFEYDPEIGWWHIPHTRALLELGETYHLFRTNSKGLRSDREYPYKTPKGRKRIILLGDSYTAGDGVSNGERFSDLLEHFHPNLDVLNFGLNGSGTDQQLLLYETKAAKYEHDAVLWCVCVENIVRNICTCRPSYDFREHQLIYRAKPWFMLEKDELAKHNIPVPLEKRPHDKLGDWVCTGFPQLPDNPSDPYAVYAHPEMQYWRLMERLFLRGAELAQRRPVFIVPLPMAEHYLHQLPPTYMPIFRALPSKHESIHVFDVFLEFIKVPIGLRQTFRFPTDPHYTSAAHRTLAEFLDTSIATAMPTLFGL